MFKFLKNLSLASRGLKYKLRIAFSLMSVLPLLACIYLFFVYNRHITQVPFSNLQISLSLFVAALIAIAGFLVAKQIVDPIVEISSEAKNIARGEFSKTIDIYREDEIGELSSALNQLNRKIRDNMQELRNYGERTKQINSEINKRVVVLSGLLQISNLISQGATLKEIYEISIIKLAQLKNAAWAILVVSDQYRSFKISAQYGTTEAMQSFLLKGGINKIFNQVLLNKSGLILDGQTQDSYMDEIVQIFDTINMIFIPVYHHAKITGFLGTGNSVSSNKYDEDDLEMLRVFAKQITISIENDFLAKRLSKLEIKDSLTGLFNKNFIIKRLEEEIKRALIYQRPCAFLLLSINNFENFLRSYGQLSSEDVLKDVSRILEDRCSEIDKIARYGDCDFAIVLPEKNKKQSIALAEEIRERINKSFSQREERKDLAISGAVSENPIDGSNPKDLIVKAENLLKSAKQEGSIFKS